VGPLVGLAIADRFERKHVLVFVALAIIVCGLAFSQVNAPAPIVLLGAGLTMLNNIMSYTFHAYQQELFPTGIRARAAGFVYSWSRFSAIFTSFIIAFVLQYSGVTGVFVFIAVAMLVVALAIGLMGPRTRNLALEAISG
jgi:MFS transporter, putative metabolite:H+ symporter